MEVILGRQVSPSFESPKAGLGFPKPDSSVERYFIVCFLPTPHLSPGGFTPLRFGAALLEISGSGSSLSQTVQAAGPTWRLDPMKDPKQWSKYVKTLLQKGLRKLNS